MAKETKKNTQMKTAPNKERTRKEEIALKHVGLAKNSDDVINRKIGTMKKTHKMELSHYALGEILEMYVDKLRCMNTPLNPKGEISTLEMEKILGK